MPGDLQHGLTEGVGVDGYCIIKHRSIPWQYPKPEEEQQRYQKMTNQFFGLSMEQSHGPGAAREGARGIRERSAGRQREETLGLGAPRRHDVHWVNSVLNNINWVHSASSFEKAQRTKPGAMQTFGFPPGRSKMFHPAREPRPGPRTKRMVTTGKYLHCLYQVSITLGEGQCPLALPPRRGCSSRPWLFHSHPSLLCVT